VNRQHDGDLIWTKILAGNTNIRRLHRIDSSGARSSPMAQFGLSPAFSRLGSGLEVDLAQIGRRKKRNQLTGDSRGSAYGSEAEVVDTWDGEN
jgi:hypothetical protein